MSVSCKPCHAKIGLPARNGARGRERRLRMVHALHVKPFRQILVPRNGSVKVFVRRIKVRGTDNQYGHFTNGSMSNTGWDQDRCHGGNGVKLTIQFDVRPLGALQYDVNLGLVAMIMSGCVLADAGQMDGSRKIIAIGKRAAGNAARTGNRRNRIQVKDGGLGGHEGRFIDSKKVPLSRRSPRSGL